MEEAYVKNIRAFKCPSTIQRQEEALFLFKVHNTTFSARGTVPLVEKLDPVWAQATFTNAARLSCKGRGYQRYLMSDMVVATKMFDVETAGALGEQIADYMEAFYRFDHIEFAAYRECRSTFELSLVFVVDISRTIATKEFLDTKEQLVDMLDMNMIINQVDDDKDDYQDIFDQVKKWKLVRKRNRSKQTRNSLRGRKTLSNNDMFKMFFVDELKAGLTFKDMELELEASEGGTGRYVTRARGCCTIVKDVECPICLVDFSDTIPNSSVLTWLPKPNSRRVVWLGCCGHAFHQSCLFKWMSKKKSSCPLCRSQDHAVKFNKISPCPRCFSLTHALCWSASEEAEWMKLFTKET